MQLAMASGVRGWRCRYRRCCSNRLILRKGHLWGCYSTRILRFVRILVGRLQNARYTLNLTFRESHLVPLASSFLLDLPSHVVYSSVRFRNLFALVPDEMGHPFDRPPIGGNRGAVCVVLHRVQHLLPVVSKFLLSLSNCNMCACGN